MARVFPREAFASKDSLRAFLRGNPNEATGTPNKPAPKALAIALSGALYAAQPVSKHKKGKRCHSEAEMNGAVETSGTPTYKNTHVPLRYTPQGKKITTHIKFHHI
jgi:hypothetical protein